MTETNSVAVIIDGEDYMTRPGSTLVFAFGLALICIDPLSLLLQRFCLPCEPGSNCSRWKDSLSWGVWRGIPQRTKCHERCEVI